MSTHINSDYNRQRILDAVNQRPMRAAELCAMLGLTTGKVSYLVSSLIDVGKLHVQDSRRDGVVYHPGPGQVDDLDQPRDGGVTQTELAPGHRRVSFGDGWRPAPGMRPDNRLANGVSGLARRGV